MSNQQNRKEHWENIYQTKAFTELSWYQETPSTSIDLINRCKPNKDTSIIDIGCGDAFLVEHFAHMGFSNVSALDISEAVILRAQERMGDLSNKINWYVSDITNFQPEDSFEIWHDRAVFHFLTDSDEINAYISLVSEHIASGGYLILGSFAKDGPTKCSGLEICQYDSEDMARLFNQFELVHSESVDHHTPFNTVQRFTFGVLRRK